MRFTIPAAALVVHVVAAAAPVQPPRWVTEDVAVRSGPTPQAPPAGMLPRGAEVILKAPGQDDVCLIEGEGRYGYIACKYLSAQPVARARAGAGGIPADQRWVTGNGLTLREAARGDAPVLARLSLNSVVRLVREVPGGAYCEVQPANGAPGFTACRYLAPAPVVLARLRGIGHDGQADEAGYDPHRLFELHPGWPALLEYAESLNKAKAGAPGQEPWPRDEVLERMKAHLALGIHGPRPKPYPDWASLKRKAQQYVDTDHEWRRLTAPNQGPSTEAPRREALMGQLAADLEAGTGLSGPLHDRTSADGGALRIAQLVRALEMPTVQPSLFHSEAELAPPGADAEQAGGRFGIVFRQLVRPRPVPAGPDEPGPGLYDMLSRTQALVRSVQRVQLFADGRLSMAPSVLRSSETLWHDVEERECAGWVPGFAFGAADSPIWRYFGAEAAANEKTSTNPPGSLYAFYTTIEMPRGPAKVVTTEVALNRAATGFVGGTHRHFDLDGDGVADLSVWEGQGKGPGHLDGMTLTDDRWYRLVLVNIGGVWKVLGSDTFGYGCGC